MFEEDDDKWWGWAWIEVMMINDEVGGIWREEKCERWNLELELELELGVKTVGEGRCNIIAIVKQILLRRARPLCQLGDSVDKWPVWDLLEYFTHVDPIKYYKIKNK